MTAIAVSVIGGVFLVLSGLIARNTGKSANNTGRTSITSAASEGHLHKMRQEITIIRRQQDEHSRALNRHVADSQIHVHR